MQAKLEDFSIYEKWKYNESQPCIGISFAVTGIFANQKGASKAGAMHKFLCMKLIKIAAGAGIIKALIGEERAFEDL